MEGKGEEVIDACDTCKRSANPKEETIGDPGDNGHCKNIKRRAKGLLSSLILERLIVTAVQTAMTSTVLPASLQIDTSFSLER